LNIPFGRMKAGQQTGWYLISEEFSCYFLLGNQAKIKTLAITSFTYLMDYVEYQASTSGMGIIKHIIV